MEFGEIVGKVFSDVKQEGNDTIIFTVSDKEYYMLYHEQDCCESVTIEDIVGDLQDLVGVPILMADEASNAGNVPGSDWGDSCTWTFYKIATIKGYVTIRWYGESNGYYSESVNFCAIKDGKRVW